MARKTVLFSPGDERDKLRSAVETPTDVVVFDLEDGVHPGRIEEARTVVRDALDDVQFDGELWVRVGGAGEVAAQDLNVVLDAETEPDALVVPKVGAVDVVREVASAAAERGTDCPIVPILETAAGVLDAQAIAAADPTDAVIFGAEDLAGDVGSEGFHDRSALSHARQHVVLAARAAGVDAIDTHFPRYDDVGGLRADVEEAVSLGYDGKVAIHPRQLQTINETFTPDPDRVCWAKRVLSARADAAESGKAIAVVDGEMVDGPQFRQAERVLDRADESAHTGLQSP